ncbi:MAG TPA: ribonuclease III [Patescibacteria group bacterium]
MNNFQELEKVIKIKFKNEDILKNALIHRSYLNEHQDENLVSNERMEFLGDAILSFITSEFFYKKFPNSNEGELTTIRSKAVRTQALAQASKKLKLGQYLFLSKGESDSGGRNNPTLLANTFEALIGAIYLDLGIEMAKKFVNETLIQNYDSIIGDERFFDYKSLFQKVVQERKRTSPKYAIIDQSGPDHAKTFKIGATVESKIIGVGVGKSKQEAEQKAAKDALNKFDLES